MLSEQLATIKTDIQIPETVSDLKLNISKSETEKILSELEITSLKMDFGSEKKEEYSAEVKNICDMTEVLLLGKQFSKVKALGIDYEEGAGLYLADSEGAITFIQEFMFINREFISDFLKSLLSCRVTLYSLNGKEIYKKLGIQTRDIAIGAYLLDPLRTDYSPEYLSSNYGTKEIPLNQPWAKAFLALNCAEAIEKSLNDHEMMDLYEKIELKTMVVLADMELTGIMVEKERLREFSETISVQIDSLKQEIFSICGGEFNLNSPKQLADVLFTKLAIPYPLKSKKISTSVDVLEKLKDDYPVVQKILSYRTYEKLRSTYADGL